MIDNKYIAEKIKNEREHLGLTQEEFGKLIGISKQSISSWEKGRNLPDILNIAKIAALSGRTLAEFFTDSSSKTCNLLMQRENYTEKEKQIIYKLRSMNAEKRKAFEILLGIKSKL